MVSVAELTEAIRSRRRSAEETVRESLAAIERLDGQVNAFVEVFADEALARARQIDEAIREGDSPGPLAGVPVAIKDNICTRLGHTTCASRILAGYRSPYDAHVVERLEAAGAIIVGKTNLDEFAMGSSGENSALGATRNPWDPQRVPGGSSAGSAAAVAARMVPASIGSDTGGSIRQPAALCGVTGLKPTYGRVSRYGLVAFGSSLDQIGPLAGTAEDCALLLQVIAGHDPRDSTCVNAPVPDYASAIRQKPARLRLGVPEEYMGEGLDAEVRSAVTEALEVFRSLGAEVRAIRLPHTSYCIPAYYLVATAEASSNLARYDGVRYGYRSPRGRDIIELYSATRAEGFGAEVKRRIMLGTFALSSGYYDAYYAKALKVRRLIKQDFDRAFEEVDLVVGPTSPTAAFRLGERTEDPLAMYLADVFTTAVNLAGIAGVSIPCGLTSDGLPVGLQLIAPPFEETRLLQAAWWYQQNTEWHLRRPRLVASQA